MKLLTSLCVSFLIAFTVISVLPVNGEESIYTDMIRLHVIAHSDDENEQALKLKVRDEVLALVTELTENAETQEEALAIFEENIDLINETAENAVKENGYEHDVASEIGIEAYPEREYETFTLPAGDYVSLRVKIGDAEGKNWWCVLFPPLCTAAASEQEDVFIAAGFSGEQYKIITETEETKYKVKFKILEILENIFG